MRFPSREHAARELSASLAALRGTNPVILAIPRGAVPMGRILADALDGELDLVLVHKIGAPGNPEYAVGAVDEHGRVVVRDDVGLSGSWMRAAADREAKELRRRRRTWTGDRPPVDVAGRVVVVVDDGIATGATVEAAVRAVAARGPERVILATPVASPYALGRLKPLVDEVVCLYAPYDLQAVGVYYDDFRQVGDDEVVEALGAVSG